MVEYTITEHTDMMLVYGEVAGNGRADRRIYQERYPHCVNPSHTLFAIVIHRLRERGTFTVNRADRGAPRRRRTPYFEEGLLHRVEEYTKHYDQPYYTYLHARIIGRCHWTSVDAFGFNTAGISISRFGHSMWFHGGRNGIWVGFLRISPVYPTKNFIPPLLHTHAIHFVSFHFFSPCNGATGVVGRHRCYSQIFNEGASSHLISL